jgi:putative nucleotidyltransferase with HDIG domain
LKELLAPNVLDVPLLPEAAGRVMAAARAADPDLRRIVALIGRDPALTGHVLRVANSAANARGGRLGSVSQAVGRLGLSAIAEMALVVSCRTRLFCAPGFEREVRQLFRHSYATALFAQEVARACRMDVESAFVAGLMHDVARPLLREVVAKLADELDGSQAASAALVDAHHAEVGALVVERWQLGPRVVEAVLHHHGDAAAPAVAVVQLADALSHLLLDEARPLDPLARHPARLTLNLYDDELAAIAAHRDKIAAAVEAVEGLA